MNGLNSDSVFKINASAESSRDIIRLDAEVEIAAAAGRDGKAVRFRGVAYGGGRLRVAGFADGVVVDLAGLEVGKSVPIQADHSRGFAARLGTASATIDAGQVVVEGAIVPGSELADRAVALLREGGVSLSVGAIPSELKFVRAGETIEVNGATHDGPVAVATASRLAEVSAVGVGADPGAVAIAANRADDPSADDTPVARERERIREINAVFRNIENGAQEADRLIEAGADIAEARGRALAMLQASRPAISGIRGNADSGGDPASVLAAAAMTLAGNGELAEKSFTPGAMQRAADLRAHTFLDICAAAIRLEGHEIPSGRDAMIRAAFSTTSMPVALGLGVEKVALGAFQSAPEAWRTLARRMPLSSFREHSVVRLAGKAAFEEVGNAGELKHAELGEESSTIRLSTYGKVATITRQNVINDDLGLLNDLPREFGAEAARGVGDLFAEVLAAGVAGNFFSVANGNSMTGASSALSIDALSTAVRMLREQTAPSGRRLNLQPKYLLVPPALESAARAILRSEFIEAAEGSPTGNSVQGIAELLVDARLGQDEWFLWSMPGEGGRARRPPQRQGQPHRRAEGTRHRTPRNRMARIPRLRMRAARNPRDHLQRRSVTTDSCAMPPAARLTASGRSFGNKRGRHRRRPDRPRDRCASTGRRNAGPHPGGPRRRARARPRVSQPAPQGGGHWQFRRIGS